MLMQTKKAVMIKICPLINLIIYLSVQIEKRDHRKENKEILHCSWTWQRFWPPQPETVRLPMLPRRWRSSSDSFLTDGNHVPPPWAWFICSPPRCPCWLGTAGQPLPEQLYIVGDSSLPESSAGDTSHLLRWNVNSFSFISCQKGSL